MKLSEVAARSGRKFSLVYSHMRRGWLVATEAKEIGARPERGSGKGATPRWDVSEEAYQNWIRRAVPIGYGYRFATRTKLIEGEPTSSAVLKFRQVDDPAALQRAFMGSTVGRAGDED